MSKTKRRDKEEDLDREERLLDMMARDIAPNSVEEKRQKRKNKRQELKDLVRQYNADKE